MIEGRARLDSAVGERVMPDKGTGAAQDNTLKAEVKGGGKADVQLSRTVGRLLGLPSLHPGEATCFLGQFHGPHTQRFDSSLGALQSPSPYAPCVLLPPFLPVSPSGEPHLLGFKGKPCLGSGLHT